MVYVFMKAKCLALLLACQQRPPLPYTVSLYCSFVWSCHYDQQSLSAFDSELLTCHVIDLDFVFICFQSSEMLEVTRSMYSAGVE